MQNVATLISHSGMVRSMVTLFTTSSSRLGVRNLQRVRIASLLKPSDGRIVDSCLPLEGPSDLAEKVMEISCFFAISLFEISAKALTPPVKDPKGKT